MSALTVRLADDKHQRLRQLAKARSTTINGLIDETVTLLLTEFDTEVRYLVRAQRGGGSTSQRQRAIGKGIECLVLSLCV